MMLLKSCLGSHPREGTLDGVGNLGPGYVGRAAETASMNDYNAPRYLAALVPLALLAGCAHAPKKPAPPPPVPAAVTTAPSTSAAPAPAPVEMQAEAPLRYTVK